MSMGDAEEELASIPLADRVQYVADDVGSRTDRFSAIPSHDLAELLGAGHPDGYWSRTWFVERLSVEDILDSGAGLEPLQKTIAPDRYDYLSAALERNELDCSVLTREERRCVEDADMKKRLNDTCGCRELAHFTVSASDGRKLRFEGIIEDDGGCIELLGPYDYREGRFQDLSDCLLTY